mmetsp:Transcript_16431/g.50328  ORF Transcript_16431/g.50328 Transcript_16431/m.50328 type:complete len:397 (-) Transcript_16431:587-1777(-)
MFERSGVDVHEAPSSIEGRPAPGMPSMGSVWSLGASECSEAARAGAGGVDRCNGTGPAEAGCGGASSAATASTCAGAPCTAGAPGRGVRAEDASKPASACVVACGGGGASLWTGAGFVSSSACDGWGSSAGKGNAVAGSIWVMSGSGVGGSISAGRLASPLASAAPAPSPCATSSTTGARAPMSFSAACSAPPLPWEGLAKGAGSCAWGWAPPAAAADGRAPCRGAGGVPATSRAGCCAAGCPGRSVATPPKSAAASPGEAALAPTPAAGGLSNGPVAGSEVHEGPEGPRLSEWDTDAARLSKKLAPSPAPPLACGAGAAPGSGGCCAPLAEAMHARCVGAQPACSGGLWAPCTWCRCAAPLAVPGCPGECPADAERLSKKAEPSPPPGPPPPARE